MAVDRNKLETELDKQYKLTLALKRDVQERDFKIEDLEGELAEKKRKLEEYVEKLKQHNKLVVKYKLAISQVEDMQEMEIEHNKCEENIRCLKEEMKQVKMRRKSLEDQINSHRRDDEENEKVEARPDAICQLESQIEDQEKDNKKLRLLISGLTQDLENKSGALIECNQAANSMREEYEQRMVVLNDMLSSARQDLTNHSLDTSGSWSYGGQFFRLTNLNSPNTPIGESMDIILEEKVREAEERVNVLMDTWTSPDKRQEMDEEIRKMTDDFSQVRQQLVESEKQLSELEHVKEEREEKEVELGKLRDELVRRDRILVEKVEMYENQVDRLEKEVVSGRNNLLQLHSQHTDEMCKQKEESENTIRECEETSMKEREMSLTEMRSLRSQMREREEKNIEEIKQLKGRNEEKMKEEEIKRRGLEESKNMLEERVKELELDVDNNRTENIRLNEEMKQLVAECRDKGKEVEEIKAEYNKTQIEIKYLKEIEEQHGNLQISHQTTLSELEITSSMKQQLEKRVADLEGRNNDLVKRMEDRVEENNKLVENHQEEMNITEGIYSEKLRNITHEKDVEIENISTACKLEIIELKEMREQEEIKWKSEMDEIEKMVEGKKLEIKQVNEEYDILKEKKVSVDIEKQDICKEREELVKKLDVLNDEVDMLQQEVNKKTNELEHSENSKKTVEDDLNGEVKQLTEQLAGSRSELEKEKQNNVESMKDMEIAITGLSNDKLGLERDLLNKEIQVGRVKEEQEEKYAEVMKDRLEEMKKKYDAEVTNMNDRHAENIEKIKNDMNDKIIQVHKEKADVETQLIATKGEIRELSSKVSEISNECKEAVVAVKDMEGEVRSLKQNKVELNKEISEKTGYIYNMEAKMLKLSADKTADDANIKEIDKELNRMKHVKNDVDRQLENAKKTSKEREELLQNQLNRQMKISKEKEDKIVETQNLLKERGEIIRNKEKLISELTIKMDAAVCDVGKNKEYVVDIERKFKDSQEKVICLDKNIQSLQEDMIKIRNEKEKAAILCDKMRDMATSKQCDIDKLKKDNEKIQQSLNQAETKFFNQMREQTSKLISSKQLIGDRDAEISNLKGDITKMTDKLESLGGELTNERNATSQQLIDKETQLLELTAAIKQMRMEKLEFTKDINKEKERTSSLMDAKLKLENEVDMLKKTLKSAEETWIDEKKTLEETSEQFKKDKDELQGMIKTYRNSSQAKLEKVKKDQEIFYKDREIEVAKNVERQYKIKLHSMEKEIKTVRETLQKTQHQLIRAKTEREGVESKLLDKDNEILVLKSDNKILTSNSKRLQSQMQGLQSPDYSRIGRVAGRNIIPKSPGILWHDIADDDDRDDVIQAVSSTTYLPHSRNTLQATRKGSSHNTLPVKTSTSPEKKVRPVSSSSLTVKSNALVRETLLPVRKTMIETQLPQNYYTEEPGCNMTWLSIQSSADITLEVDENHDRRLTELQRRNTMQPSHLKSSYPLEISGLSEVKNENIISHGLPEGVEENEGDVFGDQTPVAAAPSNRKRQTDGEDSITHSPKKKSRIFERLTFSTPLKRKPTGSTPMKVKMRQQAGKSSTSSEDSNGSITSSKSARSGKKGITFTVPTGRLLRSQSNKHKKEKK